MLHERIEVNPEIMGGKPVIRGTRIPVELILRKLAAGMSAEAILADHPRLLSTISVQCKSLPPTACRKNSRPGAGRDPLVRGTSGCRVDPGLRRDDELIAGWRGRGGGIR